MANRDNRMGFRPVTMLNGAKIPVFRFVVYASGATGLFINDLCSALSTGNIGPASADPGDIMIGSIVGLYDTNGRMIGAWDSSVSTKYLPANTGGYADVALALPEAVFVCQGLTGASPAATDVFNASDHTAGTGDTVTGMSGHELTCTFSTANMWKLLGKVEEPSNAWGEHCDMLVVAQESYWYDGTAGV